MLKSKAPLSPGESRKRLRDVGLKQKQLADELQISSSAVARFLDGWDYSQRFWDHFYKVTSLPKAS